MKCIYYKNDNAILNNIIKQLMSKKNNFTLQQTGYTSIIKHGRTRIIFNDEGKPDYELLKLINKVKSDAKKYIKEDNKEDIKKQIGYIHWYYYNNFNGQNKRQGEVLKLDLNSAYWSYANKNNIISKETFKYFNKVKSKDKKESKKMRLKALGSLATVKNIFEYSNGKLTDKYVDYDKELRAIYLYICNGVSELLRSIMVNTNALYFYWDCIFLNENKQFLDTKKYLNDLGYEFHYDFDLYELFLNSIFSYLETKKTENKYPIKKSMIL